jgi:hypothetical protein
MQRIAVAWHCRAAWLLLLLQDWLFISYKRVDGVEYALLLATFGLVLAAGLEAGIAGGILLAALHFAYRCAGVVAARTLCALACPQGCMGVLTSPENLAISSLFCPCPLPLQLFKDDNDCIHSRAQPQRHRQAAQLGGGSAPGVGCLCSACALHVLCMCSACALHVLCMCSACFSCCSLESHIDLH